MENVRIPFDFDYGAIPSLSAESRNKLEKVRPLTLGQAERISGIRNSDIMLLMVYLRWFRQVFPELVEGLVEMTIYTQDIW